MLENPPIVYVAPTKSLRQASDRVSTQRSTAETPRGSSARDPGKASLDQPLNVRETGPDSTGQFIGEVSVAGEVCVIGAAVDQERSWNLATQERGGDITSLPGAEPHVRMSRHRPCDGLARRSLRQTSRP